MTAPRRSSGGAAVAVKAAGGARPLSDELSAPESSFEKVYRGLLRGLYEGRFVPAQRLVEADLMEQFDVGRGTIREALNRLSSAGIVVMVRHRGAAIRMLSREDMYQLLDVVEILFGLAARRAAENIARNPKLKSVLTGASQAIRPFEHSDDFVTFEGIRERYYRTVMRLSGNYELPRLFPTMQVHILRIQLRRFEYAANSFEDYQAITKAILSGPPDRAEEVARAHVRQTSERLSDIPDRAFGSRDQRAENPTPGFLEVLSASEA